MSAHSIAFVLIGGPHQFLHGLPVAAELSRRPGLAVTCYVPDERDARAARRWLGRLGGQACAVECMRLPFEADGSGGGQAGAGDEAGAPRRASLKIVRLAWWAARIRAADAVVALERTSSLLGRLPGRCPPLIQIPHGAGDRARSYDRRFRLFDHALVAGEKDRERLVALGLLPAGRVHVTGYIKRAALERMAHDDAPALFADDRPVIVYNPHFARKLSSGHADGRRIVEAIVADGRWNLIVAPHVRMFEKAGEERRAAWRNLAIPGRVIVDLDSPRLFDMTYTRAADLYLGDVSSQVYEFCMTPRPCVFVDTHGAEWRDNPDYAMWTMGDVTDAASVVAAIERALAQPGRHAARQRELVARALGPCSADAPRIAADVIQDIARAGAPSAAAFPPPPPRPGKRLSARYR